MQTDNLTYVEYIRERNKAPQDAPATIAVLSERLRAGMVVFCDGEWRKITRISQESSYRYDIECGEDCFLAAKRGYYVQVLRG